VHPQISKSCAASATAWTTNRAAARRLQQYRTSRPGDVRLHAVEKWRVATLARHPRRARANRLPSYDHMLSSYNAPSAQARLVIFLHLAVVPQPSGPSSAALSPSATGIFKLRWRMPCDWRMPHQRPPSRHPCSDLDSCSSDALASAAKLGAAVPVPNPTAP